MRIQAGSFFAVGVCIWLAMVVGSAFRQAAQQRLTPDCLPPGLSIIRCQPRLWLKSGVLLARQRVKPKRWAHVTTLERYRNWQYRRSEMFELPEFVTLAKQMNDALKGKTIQRGQLGNSPHKFVWYNRSHDEFERLTKGKIVGEARAKGKWLFIPLEPGYMLLLGECGGKTLYHAPGSKVPKKYHLYITFEDDSFLTTTTQMWGAIELYEKGEE